MYFNVEDLQIIEQVRQGPASAFQRVTIIIVYWPSTKLVVSFQGRL